MVDPQNDFCPGGSLPVKDGDQVMEPLNRMMEYAKKNNWVLAASRDWHPKKTNHFAKYGGKWAVHCVKNTNGAKFHPALKVTKDVMVFSKGMLKDQDAYSAFQGYSKFGETLADYLKSYGVQELYVGGLATDYCVKESVISAIKECFKVYLLLDACRAVDIEPGDGDRAIEVMKQVGAILTTTKKVMA
ncbi:MAG: nicotinamidase/pyrazinamidase [Parcubacteria group bacterium Gr01-1014_3]|nr:MAG: nicotinamidase/pyrazinamidase [Parcubacteria group bacterium Gr01-1014_3]